MSLPTPRRRENPSHAPRPRITGGGDNVGTASPSVRGPGSSLCSHRRPEGKQSPTKRPRTRVAGGLYAAITFARPNLIVTDAGTSDSSDGSELIIRRPARAPSRPVRFEERLPPPQRIQDSSDDEAAERPTAARILRENEESQSEREAWSDSAIRSFGHALSARLAEGDLKRARRRRATSQGRREELARRRDSAAEHSESEAETSRPSLFRRRSAVARASGRSTPRSRTRAASLASAHAHEIVPEASPPVPTSFEPFHFGTRRTSRSTSRRSSEDQTSSHRSKISDSLRHIAKRTRPGVRPVVSLPALQDIGPRQFHGRTIRHLRPAASVSGLSASPTTSSGRNGDRSSYSSSGSRPGQAITAPRVLGSPGRKASIGSQNAFLTLPPHLHHLLRVPETGDLVPSRPAPLAPRLGRIRSVPALRRESSGLAAFADAAAREEAELALALAASLDSPAARGDLDRKSLERRGVDPVAGTGQIDHPFARRPSSGLPSSRSTTGGTEGSSSSDLPVLDDVSNLVSFMRCFAPSAGRADPKRRQFFRPPPSTPPRSAKVSSRRHVSTGSTNVSEPSSDRRSSSSASAKLHEARPRLNPVQEPWPATSFGRAYLGADDIIEKSARKTSTALTPTNASRESFLQFDADGDGGMGGGVPDRVASACSFIDFEEEASWLRGQLTNLSCDVTAEPAGAAEPAPPPRLSFGARRAEHLSIRSDLFLLAPSDSRSPGPQSDFAGQSTPLAGRIEEFPAPPSFDYYEEGATSPFGEGAEVVTASVTVDGTASKDAWRGGRGWSEGGGGEGWREQGRHGRLAHGSAQSAWFVDTSESDAGV